MALILEFYRGVTVGIEFPGDGLYLVLHLFIMRLMLVDPAIIEEFEE